MMFGVNFFVGVVESRDDPLYLGRCRVRVFGKHTDNKTLLPTDDLPWAHPINPITSASMNGIGASPIGPVEGSHVVIFFADGFDCQKPMMFGTLGGISSNQPKLDSDDSFVPIANQNNNFVKDISGNPVTTQSGVPVTTEYGKLPSNTDIIIEVLEIGAGYNIVKYKDGTRVKRTGARNWRNNNPGNLEYGNFTKANGALAGDPRFAIFPTYAQGREAKRRLLFEGDKYKNLTISKAISRYAPPSENNTTQYQNSVIAAVGIGDAVLSSMSPVEQNKMLNEMERVEGFRNGTLEVVSDDYRTIDETKPAPIGTTGLNGAVSNGISNDNNSSFGGFVDPNRVYPLSEYINEPDTDRLAWGNTKNTSVDAKNAARKARVDSVNGTSWSQPPAPYNAKYPYNHVVKTESGHEFEMDDTSNNERISLYHRTGTFTEIDCNGTQVNRIIGDSYQIIDRNGYISIEGTCRVTIAGDANLMVNGNANLEIDGGVRLNSGGGLDATFGGDVNFATNGDFNFVTDEGNFNIRSTVVNGPLYVRNPAVASAGTPEPRSHSSIDFEPLRTPTREDSVAFVFDDQSDEESDLYIQSLIASGVYDEAKLNQTLPIGKIDNTLSINTTKELQPNCAIINGMNNFPDSLQLSKNYNLGNLSSQSIVAKNRVTDNAGHTVNEIVCNLKTLAENCLEPILSKYKNMIVTNAFRKGSGGSQHDYGQAADMQFTGVSKSGYYEIAKWIKDNVVFDRLILEYKSTGSGMPWIHISYSSSGNNRKIFTYYNHKKHSDGLVELL